MAGRESASLRNWRRQAVRRIAGVRRSTMAFIARLPEPEIRRARTQDRWSVKDVNHEKAPFDDRRVRRALSLALDRYRAAAALSRIAFVREVAGVQVPGSAFANPPADERRLLDDKAHYIYTLQWRRIVPHSAQVRGWTITPSHYLNNQLDTVWLAK
jgi:hypothetical protein